MVDTNRSMSALQTLFADNSSGNISAQDLRDFLVSMKPAHGSLSISSSAATDITVAGTYVKAAGTTTLGSAFEMDDDTGTSNRLRYIGAPDRHFHIAASVSFSGAPNNIVGLKIAKNGVVIDASLCRRAVGTGGDIGSTAVHADVAMSTNDYIELWITNEDNPANDPTVDAMYLFAMGMFE